MFGLNPIISKSASSPKRVCGSRSSVRHRTSCFTPPTFIRTRRLSAFERIIINGSGGIDDIDLKFHESGKRTMSELKNGKRAQSEKDSSYSSYLHKVWPDPERGTGLVNKTVNYRKIFFSSRNYLETKEESRSHCYLECALWSGAWDNWPLENPCVGDVAGNRTPFSAVPAPPLPPMSPPIRP